MFVPLQWLKYNTSSLHVYTQFQFNLITIIPLQILIPNLFVFQSSLMPEDSQKSWKNRFYQGPDPSLFEQSPRQNQTKTDQQRIEDSKENAVRHRMQDFGIPEDHRVPTDQDRSGGPWRENNAPPIARYIICKELETVPVYKTCYVLDRHTVVLSDSKCKLFKTFSVGRRQKSLK